MSGQVRPASVADAGACAAVYAPYVEGTAVTFETEAPDEAEMAARIVAAQRTHAWLVAQQAGAVVGYAYAVPYRARPAYRWSCEVSVYLAPAAVGLGLGRALYEALLARLAERGYRMAVAGMTVPNPASAALHRRLGFRSCGVLRQVGYKIGRWHDVELLQRPLGPVPLEETIPPEPC